MSLYSEDLKTNIRWKWCSYNTVEYFIIVELLCVLFIK